MHVMTSQHYDNLTIVQNSLTYWVTSAVFIGSVNGYGTHVVLRKAPCRTRHPSIACLGHLGHGNKGREMSRVVHVKCGVRRLG